MFEYTNLIVGAGISGAVLARNIAENIDEHVLIIDKRDNLGGNCYDYKDNNGITIHKYGSHIFHTNNERVWTFLKRYSDFNTYMHKVYALIDGIETTIPFNLAALYELFPVSLAYKLEKKLLKQFGYNSKLPILELEKCEDIDLNFLYEFIYEKVFLNYTIKQWGKTPVEIDKSVTGRVPVFISKDSRYFQDKYQGIPLFGYSKMIDKLLNHKNIEIKTQTDYIKIKNNKFKRIFYTGSIDEFFDYKFGILPYRSVSFKLEEHNVPYYQKNSVVNYPNNYDFTRIHEYKYYLNETTNKTVIAKEYSTNFHIGKNERYYPILNNENTELYEKYKQHAKNFDNVWFLGRLGDYKYYNIDTAIIRAFECFDEIFENTLRLSLNDIVTDNFQIETE